MTRASGRRLCGVCCRTVRLRRDGMLMAHQAEVRDGHYGRACADLGRVRCAGSGRDPDERGLSSVLQNCVWCGGPRTRDDLYRHGQNRFGIAYCMRERRHGRTGEDPRAEGHG